MPDHSDRTCGWKSGFKRTDAAARSRRDRERQALEAGIVNEVYAYVAPKLFGGADAKSPVAGIGVDYPDDAYCLVSQRVQQVGEDILIAGELKNK